MMREIRTRWSFRYPAWIYVGRVSINDPLSVNRSTNECQFRSQFPFNFFETLEIISPWLIRNPSIIPFFFVNLRDKPFRSATGL